MAKLNLPIWPNIDAGATSASEKLKICGLWHLWLDLLHFCLDWLIFGLHGADFLYRGEDFIHVIRKIELNVMCDELKQLWNELKLMCDELKLMWCVMCDVNILKQTIVKWTETDVWCYFYSTNNCEMNWNIFMQMKIYLKHLQIGTYCPYWFFGNSNPFWEPKPKGTTTQMLGIWLGIKMNKSIIESDA